MPRIARVLVIAFLLMLATACSDDTSSSESANNGFGICTDTEPSCVAQCGAGAIQEPTCTDGAWQCPAGTVDEATCNYDDDVGVDADPDDASPGCGGPMPGCVQFCGSDALQESLCEGGEWVCPDGTVRMDSCPDDTCMGPPPPPCVDSCVAQTRQEAAICEGGNVYCPEGWLGLDECPPSSCELSVESTLPGVHIEFLGTECSWTQEEALAGVELPYRVIVTHAMDISPYTQDAGGCDRAGDSGLVTKEKIFGDGQQYCVCDQGLCQAPEVEWNTLQPGVYEGKIEWNGKNWNGPSDYGADYGPAFPHGTYTAQVRSTGLMQAPDAAQEFEVVGTMRIEITE